MKVLKKLLAGGIAASFLLVAAPAGAFEPIEGVWQVEHEPVAEHLIQETSPGQFMMRKINGKPECFEDTHGFLNAPVGDLISIFSGSGLDYTGFGFNADSITCEATGEQHPRIYRVVSTDPYVFAMCASSSGPPQYDANYQPTSTGTSCLREVRIRAPEPPATFELISSIPAEPKCTSRARAKGRKIKVPLHPQANEPLLSARIKLGRRTVLLYNYPGVVPPKTRIKLPAKGGRLEVALETTSKKAFKQSKRYKPCQMKKKPRRASRS